jgi:hypothetical protein
MRKTETTSPSSFTFVIAFTGEVVAKIEVELPRRKRG